MGITPQLCAHFIRLMCKRIILPNTLERQGPSVDDLKMRRRQSASAFEERFANFEGNGRAWTLTWGNCYKMKRTPLSQQKIGEIWLSTPSCHGGSLFSLPYAQAHQGQREV
ncbi:hypothetical protein ADUPG1_001007 [Aduncisulcus paluster]|uniref:Uncharacterized protein n=1 Tax=Aduncisulcus paluster TaxID=2918883 RepID=A0ABQ5KAW2_9EUKA|nr:hypothetical protein ADUPG1_001007 [Aduncisulcus paluster]